MISRQGLHLFIHTFLCKTVGWIFQHLKHKSLHRRIFALDNSKKKNLVQHLLYVAQATAK